MEGLESTADRLALKRIYRRRIVCMTALVPFGSLWWVTYRWVMRRFDMDQTTAYVGVTFVFLAGGGLLIVAGMPAAKTMGRSLAASSALTPHMRWLQAERVLRIAAKLRIILVFLISLTTLQKSSAFLVSNSHTLTDSGWFLITYLVFGFEFYWPYSGQPADELTRARQQQAARAGYSAVTLLGLCTAVYSFHHPGFAAPALPVILLLGLMACLIRMAWLERRPVLQEPHGPAPANGVRDARTRQGLSYAALAEQMDVPSRTVQAVECGRHEPSAQLAMRFAGALGTSVETLFAQRAALHP